MAKRATKSGGPFLAAAFFCENVIEDKADGALSAIRMIDQIHVVLPETVPSGTHPEQNKIPVAISAVLSFKTGDAPGEHTISAVLVSPSGKKNPPTEKTLPFSKEEYGGANLVFRTTIMVVSGGLFWLDVFLDGKRVTRMPLQISIHRESSPQGQSPA